MNTLSSAVITLSDFLLVALGQPWIVARVAEFAVQSFGVTEAAPHFAAFAWENLKGGLISLSVGATVYLLFVRPVLRPRGAYVDRWPSAWNLEARLYTPLFTRWLPALFGNAARLFAENLVLRRVCRAAVKLSGNAAEVFAENLILRRVCRGAVFAASVLATAMSDSLDALIVLSRRTFAREVKLRDEREAVHIGRLRAFRRATTTALESFNFSFALLMTCLGVILILGLLLVLL